MQESFGANEYLVRAKLGGGAPAGQGPRGPRHAAHRPFLPPPFSVQYAVVRVTPFLPSPLHYVTQTPREAPPHPPRVGLDTILPLLPILYGKYCNKVWWGGNTILRDSVGDEGGEWRAQTRGLFTNNNVDYCTKTRAKQISCKGQPGRG